MLRHFALAAVLSLTTWRALATTYTLEPDYTQGVFRWNHLGFSSPAGQFAQGQGTLEFDPAAPARSSVKVTIPLRTLSTGVPDLDEDFRSSDFFDTAKYPTATFTSTRVETAGGAQHLKVSGTLNLHGLSRPVILEVTLVKIGINPRSGLPTVGFDIMTTVKRSEFGLGAYVPQVGDDIEMHIICQAVDAKAYSEYLRAHPKK
jgi:polyisoprenoid-binding protein YceI